VEVKTTTAVFEVREEAQLELHPSPSTGIVYQEEIE
jgi:hypothetical protein